MIKNYIKRPKNIKLLILVTISILLYPFSFLHATGLWDDEKVPKNGWRCTQITDLGEDKEDQLMCEMCYNQKHRYAHTMEHDDYERSLDVGCVCAGKMEGNEEEAKSREKERVNRSAKRKNWLKLKGWQFLPNTEIVRFDKYKIIIDKEDIA